MLEPGRPQVTIRRMRIAHWISGATNTHSQYVIIIAFALQQRLNERTPMLRHAYIAACPVMQGHRRFLHVSLSNQMLTQFPVPSCYWACL